MDAVKTTITTFNKHARRYQDRFMDSDLYTGTYDKLLALVDKPNTRVLELACGPGNISRYLLDRRPDLTLFGIDLAPKMVELATANNPEAKFAVMDCRDIKQLEESYDVIVSGFCTPYLSRSDCEELLTNAASLLSPDGILYLSTMEGDYEKSGEKTSSEGDSVFMYYHDAGHLSETLTNCGLKVLELLRQDYPEQDGSVTTDLFILAKKF